MGGTIYRRETRRYRSLRRRAGEKNPSNAAGRENKPRSGCGLHMGPGRRINVGRAGELFDAVLLDGHARALGDG